MRRVVVIMAGGSGERFWPASRQKRPKQLLRLTDPDRTLLAEAVERIRPLVPADDVIIATNQLLQEVIRQGLPEVPPANVLAEPDRRNTAGCLTFAAAHLAARESDPAQVSVAVLTADHAIGDPERFRDLVDTALERAETHAELVTMGIRPTRPETGYGYIEVEGAPVIGRVQAVTAFHEKPDRPTAERFVAEGHLWNSGMFFYRLDVFASALRAHLPAHADSWEAMTDTWRQALAGKVSEDQLGPSFMAMPNVSIDVGVFEKAANVSVLPADFPWDDVGAWDALARVRATDPQGNVTTGRPVVIDSHRCVVYDELSDGRVVAVLGAKDLVVVATDDAILVCPKDQAQQVRAVVEHLKEKNRRDLL